MYKCDFCGRESFKKISLYGHICCSKHMHQLIKGKTPDNNPRTCADLNEYRYLDENTIEFDVYNQKSEVNGHFTIDAEDLDKVRWHKWRKNNYGHVMTGNCTDTNPRIELSRHILNINDPNLVVDHINCNPLDNTKKNLRICTQAQNCVNKSLQSNNNCGFAGVPWDKERKMWAPEIMSNKKKCHLNRYVHFEEAVYARFIAECLLFGEYQNKEEAIRKVKCIKNLNHERKNEIKEYVRNKLRSKGML